MEHTQICERMDAQFWIRRKMWWLANPSACKTCEGTGEWYDSGTYWEPPDGGPCTCVEEGRCPLCGFQHDEEYELGCEDEVGNIIPCIKCGWTGKRAGDVCPPRYELCDCWNEFQFRYDEENKKIKGYARMYLNSLEKIARLAYKNHLDDEEMLFALNQVNFMFVEEN